MKILIVEDEPKTADYLHKGLTEHNCVVDVARNGLDGRHLALENDYDAIVLDVMLPGVDGFGVLEALRQRRQTPVIMLTARDRALFRRAMSNLLHNATQHSPPGSRLRVELREREDGIEVAVSNPGASIPGEHLTRLFDRFYRADPSRAYSQDSHGLGLAIVKAIAKMHGGAVFARSGGGVNTIGLTLEGCRPDGLKPCSEQLTAPQELLVPALRPARA